MSDVRDLYCPLSPEEQVAKGKELAGLHETISGLELQAKASAKQYADAIKEKRSKCSELARCVSAGQEKRKIGVTSRNNLRTFTVEVLRLDTGEVVESRQMTEEEAIDARQPNLFPDIDVPATNTAPPADESGIVGKEDDGEEEGEEEGEADPDEPGAEGTEITPDQALLDAADKASGVTSGHPAVRRRRKSTDETPNDAPAAGAALER